MDCCCFLTSPQCSAIVNQVACGCARCTIDNIHVGFHRVACSRKAKEMHFVVSFCFLFFYFICFVLLRLADSISHISVTKAHTLPQTRPYNVRVHTQQFEYFNCFCAIAIYINVDLNRGLAGSGKKQKNASAMCRCAYGTEMSTSNDRQPSRDRWFNAYYCLFNDIHINK